MCGWKDERCTVYVITAGRSPVIIILMAGCCCRKMHRHSFCGLCLCINHWRDRLRIYEPVCGKCRSDGGIVNRGGADPISGCALSLEFTQIVST